MMTTNLFVIVNVKQLRTQVVLEFYCLFSRTSWGVGVLNSAIFNSFHNRVEFGTILEGLRNFGVGGLNPPTPPTVRHCSCLVCCSDLRICVKCGLFVSLSPSSVILVTQRAVCPHCQCREGHVDASLGVTISRRLRWVRYVASTGGSGILYHKDATDKTAAQGIRLI